MAIDGGIAAVIAIALVVIGVLRWQRRATRISDLERSDAQQKEQIRQLREERETSRRLIDALDTFVTTAQEVTPADPNLAVMAGMIKKFHQGKELSA